MANAEQQVVEDLAAILGAEKPTEEERQEPAVEAGEAIEQVELDEDPGNEEIDAEGTEAEQAEETGDEPWVPQSLEELAEALGVDEEKILNTLTVDRKVDGEVSKATLAELRKTNQLESSLYKRLETAANERKALEATAAQIQEQAVAAEQKRQEAEQGLDAVEKVLQADYQAIDWEGLKREDWETYQRTRDEMSGRYQMYVAAKNEIEEQRKQDSEKQQQQMQQQMTQYRAAQAQMLVEKVPDWKDEKKFTSEVSQLKEYLKNDGLDDTSINSMQDHHLWVWARKAMLYDKGKAAATGKRKQDVPKFVRPGQRRVVEQTRDKQKQAAFERAKELQTDDAWTEALALRLFDT